MVHKRLVDEIDQECDELTRLRMEELRSEISKLKKQNLRVIQKTQDSLDKQKYYMKYKLSEAENQSVRGLREQNSTLKDQIAILQRDKEDLKHQLRDINRKKDDLQFFLAARDQATDNIISTIYTIQENTDKLNCILEFDSYWYKLSSNLMMFGYEELINNFSNFNSTQPLINSDEERLVFCVLQATVSAKFNRVFKNHYKDASPAVGVLIDLNSRSVAAKEELISKLKLRMSTIKIQALSSFNKNQYFKTYNHILDDTYKYQLLEEIPVDSIMRNAYLGVRSSENFSKWAISYEETTGLGPDEAYKTFENLEELNSYLTTPYNIRQILVNSLPIFIVAFALIIISIKSC